MNAEDVVAGKQYTHKVLGTVKVLDHTRVHKGRTQFAAILVKKRFLFLCGPD